MEYMAAQMDRQIEGSISENERLSQENERLRVALRFYARGEHYSDPDNEFDSVSGEPQNWLCCTLDDSSSMFENGEVARCALLGKPINWIDGDDDMTPQPIEGEPA